MLSKQEFQRGFHLKANFSNKFKWKVILPSLGLNTCLKRVLIEIPNLTFTLVCFRHTTISDILISLFYTTISDILISLFYTTIVSLKNANLWRARQLERHRQQKPKNVPTWTKKMFEIFPKNNFQGSISKKCSNYDDFLSWNLFCWNCFRLFSCLFEQFGKLPHSDKNGSCMNNICLNSKGHKTKTNYTIYRLFKPSVTYT